MREMQVLKWCDGKHGDDRAYVHADHEVVVAFDRGKNQLLDLCDGHYDEFVVPLLTLLDEKGVNVDQIAHKGKVHNLVKSQRGVVSTKLPGGPCPEPGCGTTPPTRGALGQHLKQHHGTGLTDYPELKLDNSPSRPHKRRKNQSAQLGGPPKADHQDPEPAGKGFKAFGQADKTA